MTKISKKIITWLLGAVAFVAVALGIVFTRPQTKTVSADTAVTFNYAVVDDGKPEDGYISVMVETDGQTWSTYHNGVSSVDYKSISDYMTINGRTITEINDASTSAEKISYYIQPAGSFSFVRITIPSAIEDNHNEIQAIGILDGWSFNNGSETYTSSAANFLRVGNEFTPVENYTSLTKKTAAEVSFSDVTVENNFYKISINFGEDMVAHTGDKFNPMYAWFDLPRGVIYLNGKSVNEWNEQLIAADAKYGTPSTYSESPQNSTEAGHIPVFCKPICVWATTTGFQLCVYKDVIDNLGSVTLTVGQGFAPNNASYARSFIMAENATKVIIDRTDITNELKFVHQEQQDAGTEMYLIRTANNYWTKAPKGGCLNEYDFKLSGAGQEQMH